MMVFAKVRRADKIVVLERGRVTENGTHKELMKLKTGAYRQMVHQGGFDDEQATTTTPPLVASEVSSQNDH
jgi:subfamily B ATP-binding cassette protein MsbA